MLLISLSLSEFPEKIKAKIGQCGFLISSLIFTLAAASLTAEKSFSWTTVSIGGGGFVSSIISSPVEKNLFYARTDVGGSYRWDESSKRWVSMMDWVDVSELGLLGVEAIAADPVNPDKVYMVAGTTYWNEGRSAFLRSCDKGRTWQVFYTWDTSGVKGSKVKKFYAHGNGMGRGNGEALAIDPQNPDIMLYGSKGKGLFRSTDNGETWNHLDDFTKASGHDTTWNGSGFSFVTFAPGNSSVVYAGFLRSKDNVFRSKDGGITWELIPGRIKPATKGGYAPALMPQRIAITPDGSLLYITFGDGAGPHTMAWDEGWGPIKDWFNRGAVLRFETASEKWLDVSPENMVDPGDNSNSSYYDVDSIYAASYSGISLNPSNPLEIVVSSMGYRGPQFWYIESTGKWKDQWGSNIYYTNDGGKHWIPSFQYYWMDGGVYPSAKQMSENGIGWMFNSSIHWAGCVAMDPFNPKRVFTTSGNGVFATDNITSYIVDSSKSPVLQQSTVWKVMSHGIEETVPLEVISIPGGPMISVIGDYDGFCHYDVTKYPSKRHLTDVSGLQVPLGTTRALAWAPKSGHLVKVSDAQAVNPTGNNNVPVSPIQFSSDTGKSWTVATYESIPGKYVRGESVAISADGKVTLWVPSHKTVNGSDVAGDYPVQRYENSAWTEVSGIDGAFVAGDPEKTEVFYAFKRSEGIFYKSTDMGIKFEKAGAPGSSTRRKFRLTPGKSGDIWVPLGENGLSRSDDGALTFKSIESVSSCEAVGFGKAAEGKNYPTVYIFGKVGNQTGVFQSIDEGATWERVNDDDHEYGGLANGEFIVGDMNTFGVVYMSTAGRGIACRLPSSMVGTGRAVTPKKNKVAAAWRIEGEILHILPAVGEKNTIAVYTLTGRRCFFRQVSNEVHIPLQKLLPAEGVHILSIGTGNSVQNHKITTSRRY